VAQALGAIVALALTVWISWNTTSKARRDARDSAGIFVHMMIGQLCEIERSCQDGNFAEMDKARRALGELLQYARSVPIAQLNKLSAWEYLQAQAFAFAFLVEIAAAQPVGASQRYPAAKAARIRLEEFSEAFARASGFRVD
jgi:hypothetical protein